MFRAGSGGNPHFIFFLRTPPTPHKIKAKSDVMGFLNIHPDTVQMGFLGKDFQFVFPDKCSNHNCIKQI